MIYTTKDLAEGNIVLEYNGDRQRLEKIVTEAFPGDGCPSGSSKYYYLNNNDCWASRDLKIEVPEKFQGVKFINEDNILTMAEYNKLVNSLGTFNPNPPAPSIQSTHLTFLPADLQEAINTLGRYGVTLDVQISINGKNITL